MKVFYRLLQFARPFRHFVPEYILYVVPATIFGALNFTLLIPLFDTLFQVGATENIVLHKPTFSLSVEYLKAIFNYNFDIIALKYGKIAALNFICGIVLCSVLFSNLFLYMSQRTLSRMRTWLVYNMRKKLFEKYSGLHIGFFNKYRKGDLLSIISADSHEIENTLVSAMQVVFRDPLKLVIYFSLLFIISFKLTIFTVLFFPLAALLITFLTKRLKQNAKSSQLLLGRILSITEETISGIRIIKAFCSEKFARNVFDRSNDKYRKVSKRFMNRRELASPLSEFLGVLVIIGIVLFGGTLILSNKSSLTASEFISYVILYSQIIPPIKNISNTYSSVQRGLAAGERILKIIDSENEIKEISNPIEIKDFKDKIEYKNVSFAYDEGNVLQNINITIQKGRTIALVGQSGSGKSTLVDLIPRFYDPKEGAIFIDGINIKDLTLNSLRGLLGIVTQEPLLFNDTIFNNIAFGITNVSEDDVIQAAKIANAHDFIMEMENGYSTNIADRGNRLSGGQRQRISIARAILKNPAILILDEATSALDTESEKQVQDAIDLLMSNRTSIVIAHRLSTIQNADEIIVVQQGEIIERGTHASLLNSSGIYKKLYEMQLSANQ